MSLPPALFILSSVTFQTLHIIPSTALELFSPLTYSTTPSIASSTTLGPHPSQSSPVQSPITSSKPVSLARLSIDNATHGNQHRRHHRNNPHPVFTLSHRLLAYASPSPSPPSSIKSSHPFSSAPSTPSNPNSSLSSSPSPFGLGLGSGMVNMNLGKVTNMTQADLGHAALKVGETVWGGVKMLSRMAYGASRNRVSGDIGRVSRA